MWIAGAGDVLFWEVCGEVEALECVHNSRGAHGSLRSRSCLGNYVLHTLTDVHRAEMRWQILAISDKSPLCNLVLMSISELSQSAGRQGHVIQRWETADDRCDLNYLIILGKDHSKIKIHFKNKNLDNSGQLYYS